MKTRDILILLFVSIICNNRVQSTVWPHPEFRVDKPNDLIHTYLPQTPPWSHDATLVVTTILLLVYRKKVNWRRLFVMLLVFYTLRAIFITCTTLPTVDGKNECKHDTVGACTDYFFSGHTSYNLIASYQIGSPVFPWWPLVSTFITAMSRYHYTIDVLMPWVFLGLMTAPALR